MRYTTYHLGTLTHAPGGKMVPGASLLVRLDQVATVMNLGFDNGCRIMLVSGKEYALAEDYQTVVNEVIQ